MALDYLSLYLRQRGGDITCVAKCQQDRDIVALRKLAFTNWFALFLYYTCFSQIGQGTSTWVKLAVSMCSCGFCDDSCPNSQLVLCKWIAISLTSWLSLRWTRRLMRVKMNLASVHSEIESKQMKRPSNHKVHDSTYVEFWAQLGFRHDYGQLPKLDKCHSCLSPLPIQP